MSDDENQPRSLRERARRALVVFRELPRTFRVLWDAARIETIFLAVVVLGNSLVPAAIAWVAKLIIDSVIHAAQTHDAADRAMVMEYVAIELGLVVGRMLFTRASALLRERIGQELKRTLARQVLDKALALEVRHFEDSTVYDKMQNARREADSRPLKLVTEAFNVVGSTITLTSLAALLWRLAPWSLIVLVVASIPSFLIELKFAARAYRMLSYRAPEHRRLNYLEWILTRDATVKEVKLFNLGPLVLGRFVELFQKVLDEDRRLSWRRAIWGTLLGLVSTGAFYACYAWVADTAARGELTIGDLTLYLTVFRQGQSTFGAILTNIGAMYEGSLFMSNLFTFLDVESHGEKTRGAPVVLSRGPGHALELRNVSFTYPKKQEPVLRNISLEVRPGEKIAFVGENGAGKTTLIKLLMRLYEPTEGEILYGGVDIRDLDIDDLRSRFSAVFQDFVRYQIVVRENIAIGDVKNLADLEQVTRAAEKGGATPIVEKLPGAWDAMLGGWFQEGAELSGGQWQKLALARAFMREDAEVLILDEPSAAIDARAETELFERFRALAQDKIAFLISHRFSTVRMADRIAVLDNGSIVELGSHDELVSQGGLYAQLFQLQAQGYR